MNDTEIHQRQPDAAESHDRYRIVLKVGGNELDDENFLYGLALTIKKIIADGHSPIIVHGGGKAIAHYQKSLGLVPQFIDGLRITDSESLDVAEMVLSGLMNKRIVRALLKEDILAAGFSGVDGGTLYVEKMWHPLGDLGRVGDVQDVDATLLQTLIGADIVPVISPISLGAHDNLSYNVNADHAATAVAAKLGALKLIFVSNVPGVLVAGRVARAITSTQAEAWIEDEIITGGMIPKVRSAIHAVRNGVAQAVITNLAGIQADEGTGIIGTA
ncbi:MAG TPA: acetylglutamate kinase [Caldilineaceae bacterium]|nr:acetylglutamate kinase [Caldilineaceae bacterium]